MMTWQNQNPLKLFQPTLPYGSQRTGQYLSGKKQAVVFFPKSKTADLHANELGN